MATAVQFEADRYLLFDDTGATMHDPGDPLPEELTDCWAICDCNQEITRPCKAFQRQKNPHVIQASSPKPERWKEWRKQWKAALVIADLPRPLEVAAIV